MLLLATFIPRHFKLMILNDDETCHFAFAQYEKGKSHVTQLNSRNFMTLCICIILLKKLSGQQIL